MKMLSSTYRIFMSWQIYINLNIKPYLKSLFLHLSDIMRNVDEHYQREFSTGHSSRPFWRYVELVPDCDTVIKIKPWSGKNFRHKARLNSKVSLIRDWITNVGIFLDTPTSSWISLRWLPSRPLYGFPRRAEGRSVPSLQVSSIRQ